MADDGYLVQLQYSDVSPRFSL